MRVHVMTWQACVHVACGPRRYIQMKSKVERLMQADVVAGCRDSQDLLSCCSLEAWLIVVC